ncbi:sodium-dependent dopamine transporter-like [Pecten maximus]|uniref:sodium-dependent dopamine transporter-like n=1 Tax=Pecten maximus TaxID=6579 RepID=UPI001458FC42|nr:sodium-dependent dopamine transporter-like [Pecten maximus]
MEENSAVTVKWTSRVEFIVALLGYSIGMPEFWRVPYLTYRNGGEPNLRDGETCKERDRISSGGFRGRILAVLYITALLPVLLVLAIWIRALTLPGASKGLLYFVSADFRRFADTQLWIEASFQTFLTLGPGWGGLMMMGAHNKFRTNVLRSSILSTTATLTFGLINGLVVFSVLGVMSEEIGVPIEDMMTSGGTYRTISDDLRGNIPETIEKSKDHSVGCCQFCDVSSKLAARYTGTHRVDRDVRLLLSRPLPSIVRISTAFIMPVFLTCLLVISVFTYKPPSFGEYNYPVYARAIGWCFTMSSLLPALGYSVWVIVNAKGTFGQRIKHLSRHTPRWIPANVRAANIYRDSERSADFTWKQLFWFNLTGRGGIVIKDCGDSVPML